MAIDYQKRDGVAYITLNNLAKANILDKTSDALTLRVCPRLSQPWTTGRASSAWSHAISG